MQARKEQGKRPVTDETLRLLRLRLLAVPAMTAAVGFFVGLAVGILQASAVLTSSPAPRLIQLANGFGIVALTMVVIVAGSLAIGWVVALIHERGARDRQRLLDRIKAEEGEFLAGMDIETSNLIDKLGSGAR